MVEATNRNIALESSSFEELPSVRRGTVLALTAGGILGGVIGAFSAAAAYVGLRFIVHRFTIEKYLKDMDPKGLASIGIRTILAPLGIMGSIFALNPDWNVRQLVEDHAITEIVQGQMKSVATQDIHGFGWFGQFGPVTGQVQTFVTRTGETQRTRNGDECIGIEVRREGSPTERLGVTKSGRLDGYFSCDLN